MIIGKDSFQKKPPIFQKQSPSSKNQYQTNRQAKSQYVDVLNKNDMADKTLELLQNNLKKGLITLDEFKRKCDNLKKFREK